MKIFEIFECEDDLADYLDKNTCDWMGGFSKVWDLSHLTGKNLVLKVTEDEPYQVFLDFIDKHPELKHLPKVHDHIIIDGCSYVLLDKLTEAGIYLDEYACSQGWWEHDTQVWEGLSPSLDKTLNELETWFNNYQEIHQLHWDLRDSNVMKEPFGELLITDPWSSVQY